MNSKRQLSGLNRVDFSKKTDRQAINYLRKKYELLGYDVPQYLQGKTLSKGQLNSAIAKITRGLTSAIKREQRTKSKMSTSDKLDKQLNSLYKKYNKEVDKTLEALSVMGLPSKQIQYLKGEDTMFPTVRKKSFIYDGVPLQHLEDIEISDNATKKEMVKKFKQDMKEISFISIYNKLNDSSASDQWFEQKFLQSEHVSKLSNTVKNSMRKEFNQLSPIQKELFIKGELSELREKYEGGSTTKEEKIKENIYGRFVNTIQTYKREDLKGVYD